MKMFRRLLTSRFGRLGLVSDLAMVFTAARKIAGNPKTRSARLSTNSKAPKLGPGEWALVVGAAFRLVNRARSRRSTRAAR